MEEFKVCPYCGEQIKAIAKKCRFCGQWLEDSNAQQPAAPTVAETPATPPAPVPPAPEVPQPQPIAPPPAPPAPPVAPPAPAPQPAPAAQPEPRPVPPPPPVQQQDQYKAQAQNSAADVKKAMGNLGGEFKSIGDDIKGQQASIGVVIGAGIKYALTNLMTICLTSAALLVLVILLKLLSNDMMGELVGGMIPMFLIVIGWGIHVFYMFHKVSNPPSHIAADASKAKSYKLLTSLVSIIIYAVYAVIAGLLIWILGKMNIWILFVVVGILLFAIYISLLTGCQKAIDKTKT